MCKKAEFKAFCFSQILPRKKKNKKQSVFHHHRTLFYIHTCQALLPTSIFDYIFGEVVDFFQAMDKFTGRKKK